MRVGGTTIKSKYQQDVTVWYEVAKIGNHLHTITVTGICGESVDEKRITIGANDGQRPAPPDTKQLQTMLDTYRQKVADDAAWKESVRLSIINLH